MASWNHDTAPVAAYHHDRPQPAQIPDTKPGDYYVTARDDSREPKTAFLLGPYRDDHAAALARVAEARAYVLARYSRSPWWTFGTARIDAADDNPTGKLNEVLA